MVMSGGFVSTTGFQGQTVKGQSHAESIERESTSGGRRRMSVPRSSAVRAWVELRERE